jgi:hypothetical protein
MTKARQLADLGNAYDDGALSNRNMIINGAMQVAQRGTSFTGVTSTNAYHIDRFETGSGDSSSQFTVSQATAGLNGFANSLKFDCTTAQSSLGADSRVFLQQKFEGQNLQRLKKGTSDAEKITVSFYVKSTKTGTYIVELYDNDNNRQISQAYTISSSDTWEQKILTFDGDTTGSFNNDNALSLSLYWHLVAGSRYSSGTLSTSWTSTTDANRAVGQVNLADSTSNNWEITGVQLEVGDTATPFEHRSYGDELARCQRYFYRHGDFYYRKTIAQSFRTSSSDVEGVVTFPNTMRTVPTFIATSGTNYYRDYCLGSGTNLSTVGAHNIYVNNAVLQWTGHPRSAGQAGYMRANNAGATVDFDAEL